MPARAGRGFPSRAYQTTQHGTGNVSVALGVCAVAIAALAPTPAVSVPLGVCTVSIATPAVTPVSNAGAVLQPATITIATPQPGIAAGPVPLGVSTVSIATPAPAPTVKVPLGVCTVTISTPAPRAGVTSIPLGVSPVTIATPAITPAGIGVKLGTSTVSIAVPAVAPVVSPHLSPATVTIATPQPGIHKGFTVPLGVCANTITVYPVTPVASRNLLVSLASEAGIDDFGNSFPAGLMTTTGVIEGTTISGSVFEGTDFIIGSSGAFFYSGTPAAGNLVQSVTSASGTDTEGNAYLAGITTYSTGLGNFLASNLTSGGLNFYSASSYAGPWSFQGGLETDSSGDVIVQGTLKPLNNLNVGGNATVSGSINGATNFSFLKQIGQMSHYNETATGGWTGSGALVGSQQVNLSVLSAWMNEVAADIGTILTRLQNENYMA